MILGTNCPPRVIRGQKRVGMFSKQLMPLLSGKMNQFIKNIMISKHMVIHRCSCINFIIRVVGIFFQTYILTWLLSKQFLEQKQQRPNPHSFPTAQHNTCFKLRKWLALRITAFCRTNQCFYHGFSWKKRNY